MRLWYTPNVHRVLRADPVLAMAVELLRREDRPGSLHLFRSDRRGPFSAVWYGPTGERREGQSERLDTAILRALGAEAA